MNFSSDFLTKQIIAYIGNKRSLLFLIYKALSNFGLENASGLKFFDVFAGSGVVSRFAKSLNYEVYSNDWENYSFVINSCFLGVNKSEIANLFGSEEEYKKLLQKINNLPEPSEQNQYIAKYYAPKEFDISKANYKTERLFYTRENALIIDKIRNYIEETFPANNCSEENIKKRNILLAELLYEAGTHNNTSGVFKACHKGFGGHGKDALTRILRKIELKGVVLEDSTFENHIFQQDANILVKEMPKVDVAYLDPPYNQHQYGSNYHLLNTISKWDHLPLNFDLNKKGELKEKAAIRHDWTETRSPYCYKETAIKSFEELITNLKAKYILISYSTDGIIPFDEMKRICMEKGEVSIVTNEYTTYRGGKQSNNRKNTNIEFILCVDTSKTNSQKNIEDLDSILTRKKVNLLFKSKYNEQKLKKTCKEFTNDTLIFEFDDYKIQIKTKYFFTLQMPESINQLSTNELKLLCKKLEECVCATKQEEILELLNKIDCDTIRNARIAKQLPKMLQKLASKKNKQVFCDLLNKICELEKNCPTVYSKIQKQLEEVKNLANIRFYG